MGKKEQLKLTYLHNCGIAIEKDELLIIIDYALHIPGGRGEELLAGIIPADLIQKKSKVLVLVTHRHIDHYNKNILKWGKNFGI